MITHLLKTDWFRLRWLILGTWAILVLAMLPWLLHDPRSFTLPWTEAFQGNHALKAVLDLHQGIWLRRWSLYAVTGSTLLLATAIGMHDFRWQRVTPVRGWQRLAAKVLAVLLFLVAPQVLLGMAVMWKQGFSTHLVLGSAAEIALSLALLHGTVAVFGRQCGSIWIWTPAVACLAAAIYLPFLLGSFFPAVMSPVVRALWNLMAFLDAWAETSGPPLWIYLALALAAVSGIPRLLRTRPGTIPATAAAIGGLILAGMSVQWITPRQKFAELDLPALKPAVSAGDLRTQNTSRIGISGRASVQTSVEARISTEGEVAGKFVRWLPYPADMVHSLTTSTGILRSPSSTASLRAALPAPLASPSLSFDEEAEVLPIADEHSGSMPVTGIVFHHETLVDMPLSETPATFTNGNEIPLGRLQFARSSSFPLPELILRFASRKMGKMPLQNWNFPNGFFPFEKSFVFVLYLPKQKVCVRLVTRISQYTPIPGGGSCVRYVLRWDDGQLDRASLAGARLIVLRPVIDGILKRQLQLPPIPEPDWQNEGVRPDQGTRITEADYFTKIRPNRPDPATCTEDEFDRYLRTVGNMWPGFVLKGDLAEYAPRFPQVLARYLSSRAVANAVGEIVVESAKADVVSAIGTPQEALNAAEMLTRRGWQDEARGPLLECLGAPFMAHHKGVVYPVITALAELEDPTTYPALIAAYENTGMSYYYGIIRPLPGIKPQLDAAVERISGNLKTSLLEFTSFSSAISDALEAYEAPVSHGNAIAFSKLLEFWGNLAFETIGELDESPPPDEKKGDRDQQPEYSVMASGDVGASAPMLVLKDFTRFFQVDPPIPHKLAAWRAFMARKTAADFTYDPLARKWRASPTK